MSAPSTTPTEIEPPGTAAPNRIAMPFRGRWIRKVFVRGLGLPRQRVYSVLRGIKAFLHPRQVRERQHLGRQLEAEQPGLREWRRNGYRMVGPEELPGLENALSICRSIFAELRAAGTEAYEDEKVFLLTPLLNQQFCAYPELVRFSVSEPLIRAASAYLGTVPVFASARLWWSPTRPQSTPTSSQRFHSDHEDTTQVKLLLYVEDVSEGNGPFSFFTPEASDRIRAAAGTRRGRIDDAKVSEIAGREKPISLVGPAGTAAFVDPSRCLHFGSRAYAGDRFALSLQFLRYHSPTESSLALRLDGELAREAWSPLQRLVLGLREKAA